jgi:hypothetical protein
MAKNQKILISENSSGATARISELKQKAVVLTGLIEAYNLQPVLKKITTAEQCKEFLTDPLRYMDQAVLTDTGFRSTVTPSPLKVAELYGINYSAIQQKISLARIATTPLELFSFNESDCKVELLGSAEEIIREQSKIYLSDPEEIEEYTRVKALTDLLNDYCTRYNVHTTNMHQIPANLGLRCDVKESGQGYQFNPDIRVIRKSLNI